MTNNLESVPSEWTSADDTFFCLVQRLFDPAFLYGAGVLLASYDPAELDDAVAAPVVTETPVATRTASSAQHC